MKIVDGMGADPGMPDGQPQAPKINMADAEDLACEECGCKVFEEKMMIKKVSKFLTGSDKDQISPVQVIACAKCAHVNEMFIPKFN
jgi:hypothetical protein